MDTRITGIINPGDTQVFKEWLETQFGSKSERNIETSEIRKEIALLRQTVDTMHKKIDNIERILEEVSE